MKRTNKETRKFLERIKTAVIKSYRQLNLRASGNFERNTRIVGSRSRGTILSFPGYGFFIGDGVGRRPGKFPPIDKIKDWIKDKPILARSSTTGRFITRDQAAYLIGKKIAEKGTSIYPGAGGRAGIPYQEIVKDQTDKHGEKVADAIFFDILESANFKTDKPLPS